LLYYLKEFIKMTSIIDFEYAVLTLQIVGVFSIQHTYVSI
jgi:hypothetical protein